MGRLCIKLHLFLERFLQNFNNNFSTDLFNTLAPRQGKKMFFDNQDKAMKCDCPPDCSSQHYMFDTSISQIP